MTWQDHITVDPTVCHGQACVRGTRIPVAVVLANLAAGLTAADLRRSYPGLGPDAVPAALAYAAEYACHTVYDERLARAPDPDVAAACRAEGRVLVATEPVTRAVSIVGPERVRVRPPRGVG